MGGERRHGAFAHEPGRDDGDLDRALLGAVDDGAVHVEKEDPERAARKPARIMCGVEEFLPKLLTSELISSEK